MCNCYITISMFRYIRRPTSFHTYKACFFSTRFQSNHGVRKLSHTKGESNIRKFNRYSLWFQNHHIRGRFFHDSRYNHPATILMFVKKKRCKETATQTILVYNKISFEISIWPNQFSLPVFYFLSNTVGLGDRIGLYSIHRGHQSVSDRPSLVCPLLPHVVHPGVGQHVWNTRGRSDVY